MSCGQKSVADKTENDVAFACAISKWIYICKHPVDKVFQGYQ